MTTVAAAVLLAVLVLAVAVGPVPLSPGTVQDVVLSHLPGHLFGRPTPGAADTIVWQVRVPRVLLAAVVGAALTTAGAVMQTLVRNSLADPFLLGISSGASVGATAVLLFGALAGLGVWALSGGSVLGALGATLLVFGLARGSGGATTQLILTGVVVSALFSSVASYLLFQGNPQATQSVLFYLLGSFGSATWTQLPLPAATVAICLALLLLGARDLNALALGAGPAAALGVDVPRVRGLLFVVVSLLAGTSVAVSGVVGFVGLVVPHMVRLVVGSDHRRVLPLGIVVGAAFMVLGDLLCRTVVGPQEMPVGVITALVGAPVLLILLRRRAAA